MPWCHLIALPQKQDRISKLFVDSYHINSVCCGRSRTPHAPFVALRVGSGRNDNAALDCIRPALAAWWPRKVRRIFDGRLLGQKRVAIAAGEKRTVSWSCCCFSGYVQQFVKKLNAGSGNPPKRTPRGGVRSPFRSWRAGPQSPWRYQATDPRCSARLLRCRSAGRNLPGARAPSQTKNGQRRGNARMQSI